MNGLQTLLLLAVAAAVKVIASSTWSSVLLQRLGGFLRPQKRPAVPKQPGREQIPQAVQHLAADHEAAAVLAALISRDGAGTWPPAANHDYRTWPAAIQPYAEIYSRLCSKLATTEVSLDDDINRARIDEFRSEFRSLLQDLVDLDQVRRLFESAEAGKWDIFPRSTYNAMYCCIATCRHAYRWVQTSMPKIFSCVPVTNVRVLIPCAAGGPLFPLLKLRSSNECWICLLSSSSRGIISSVISAALLRAATTPRILSSTLTNVVAMRTRSMQACRTQFSHQKKPSLESFTK